MTRQGETRVYVGLGSNQGDRVSHIRQALSAIASLPGVCALRSSSVYETRPMGPQDQPDFLNAVCRFDYTGSAASLLQQLQSIERGHGRQQGGPRWGMRPLDLDILLYGEELIDTPDLQVPHAGLGMRSFVLWPLAELSPGLHVPGLGSVESLRRNCQHFGIRVHEEG
ncbi:MAG: 2-amino-4-hydroxy-6-hydroxymethyldihydropteridine diphosphokinase [Granulosicoccus sp.]|nr:2-amino-4-hydroxy-6-hydroxymethyldihydropteridine diphosphokinase [Granulosicoccus sp.]